MSFTSWLRNLRGMSWSHTNQTVYRGPENRDRANGGRPWRWRTRLNIEHLEERHLMSVVSFAPHVDYPVGEGPRGVAVADFDSDGQRDFVTLNGGSVSVLLGNGDGSFKTAHDIPLGSILSSVGVGDFNGDHKPDLAVGNGSNSTVSVLLGNGDGSFQAARIISSRFPNSLAVGDFNGDGRSDLAVATNADNTIDVLLGNGDGAFQALQQFSGGSNPWSLGVGDFNGDRTLDLAISHISGPVSVLLGNGDATFRNVQNISIGGTVSLAVGNFDGDGRLDLVATSYPNTLNVLRGNGEGTFDLNGVYMVGTTTYPVSVGVGDFNADAKADLAVASYNSGTVGVLIGRGDTTFQSPQNFFVGGGPYSVAVGDFNGDGQPDLATPNLNLTTVNVLLNQLVTTTTLSGPPIATYGAAATLTATVASNTGPVTSGMVTFSEGSPLGPPVPLDANGQAVFSIATLPPGEHTIAASYSGVSAAGASFAGSASAAFSVTVNPVPLSATGVNFAATAGAPLGAVVATFESPAQFSDAASYSALIEWGNGTSSFGNITDDGTFSVGGIHTYAEPGSYAVSVEISHILGYATATISATAAVTSLGLAVQRALTADIGFWNGASGQALINSFNGDQYNTSLSAWLAENFSNLYGSLWGYTNADMAAYYQGLFAQKGPKAEAQLLAAALNIYATTRSLGGTAGQAYGFNVTDAGLGAYCFNVGKSGEAFGMANNSPHTVYAYLQAVDRDSWTILSTDSLRKQVNDLFDALNKAGRIR